MSVLGHRRIIEAMQCGDPKERLYISPILDAKQIGDASIDIRLGNDFFTTRRGNLGVLDPKVRDTQPDRFRNRHRLNTKEPFYLHPNEVALAGTMEYFRFPKALSASVTSRSKWGRLGLIIATATAIHPGFKGVITLELVNHGNVPLVLYPGLLIAQVIFYETDGATPYDGDLSGKTDAHPSDISKGWQSDMQFWCDGNQ